jgi:aldehyde:ferredoxin oxidoreductase
MAFHSRHAGVEKAENVARHQDWRTVFNALVICFFANVPPSGLVELTNTACGLQLDLEGLMRTGERGWQLKRVINNRLGIRRADDVLPAVMRRPYPDQAEDSEGGFAPDFEPMLAAYYQARGWEAVSGFPTRQRLEALGLGWAADDLDGLAVELPGDERS